MRLLDLCSGTGSVSKKALELGYEVVSLDITDQYHSPTILADIMEWDYKTAYPRGYFDIVWGSPPCRTFSTCRRCHIGRSLSREQYEWDILNVGLPVVRRVQEIIEWFAPDRWYIENPQTGRLKDYMVGVNHHDVDYCRYANYGIRKRTRIWTNDLEFEPKLCNKQCYRYQEQKRHLLNFAKNNLRRNGDLSCTTLAERYRVPPMLIEELISPRPL